MRLSGLRLWAAAISASLGVAGCWHVPLPPNDSSTDAYGWKAPIEIPGTEPYYRFQVSENLRGWMKQHSVESFAIFDADGKLQSCGPMSAGSNNPLATMPAVIQGHITPFDPAICGTGPAPKLCFKNKPCAIPDFCSPQIIDVAGTSLEGMTNLSEILAAAHSSPVRVACRPDTPDASRICDENDAKARSASRLAYEQQLEAREFIDNFGIESELQASSKPEAPSASVRLDPNDLLVTLDQVPPTVPQLTFQWNKPSSIGHAGTAKLTCYNPDGSTLDEGINIEPNGAIAPTGPMLEYVGIVCRVRNYRVVLHPSLPDLVLEAVTATTFAPKPFMHGDTTQFWVAPSGRAPYSAFFEANHGACGGTANVAEVSKLPHARDADWPPSAGDIGAPGVHPRDAWIMLLSSKRDVVAWLYWLGYVGSAFLFALIVTLARWAWLASLGAHANRSS